MLDNDAISGKFEKASVHHHDNEAYIFKARFEDELFVDYIDEF